MIVLTILLVLFFRVSIPTAYAELFEVDNAEKGADAIICLSGGKYDPVPKTQNFGLKDMHPKFFLRIKRK